MFSFVQVVFGVQPFVDWVSHMLHTIGREYVELQLASSEH
jgi:hypothetical protein